MDEEELLEGLSRFGLTPYEIKVYRSLLMYGPQTSTNIVKNSSIPQPRVYDVCNTLIRKGFIEVSPGRSKIYRAVPISLSLRKGVQNLGNFVDDLETYLGSLKQEKRNGTPYMWLVEEDKNVTGQISGMIARSRDELIISLSAGHLKSLSRDILAALSRGVTIAMVVFSDTTDEEIESLPKSIVLKKREARAAEIAIADRSSGLVNMSIINRLTPYAVFFEEDEMIHILSFYFLNVIWSPSEFVNSFPNVKSRKFRTGWLTCEAIQQYLDTGTPLWGELDGITQDSKIQISGKIEGTEQVRGVKYSFFINDGNRTYSVGGKTASLEDIAMLRLHLSRDQDT